MTKFDEVSPTEGAVAQAHELIFDIAVKPAAGQQPVWVNVPDITALNPQFPAQLQAITTYAHKGKERQTKVGSGFSLGFNILKIRDAVGEFQAEWLLLKAASDADGSANEILFRYYDALGASDAYQGTGLVGRDARPENGAQGPGWDAFTLTGAGDVVPIVNPARVGKTSWNVTIGGAPTGGSYTLRVNGFATAPIAYNAAATAVAAAINALSGVTGISGVSATGTAPIALTFPSAVVVSATSALTGGTSPTVTVA